MAETAQDIATVEEAKAPAPSQDSASLMDAIGRAASDPNTDVEKMERLMGLYERMQDRQAKQAFNEAMAAAKQEMPYVVRDARNDQTKSTYARLETISDAVDPVIAKHGFSLSFGTDDCPIEAHYRITCDVAHEGGHEKRYHADVPADMTGMKGNQNKTATHGYGSTLSYGRRYLKVLIFDIKIKGEDDDGQAGGTKTITEEQCDELLKMAEDCGVDKAKFCEYFKIDGFPSIPAHAYERAKAAILKKKEKADA